MYHVQKASEAAFRGWVCDRDMFRGLAVQHGSGFCSVRRKASMMHAKEIGRRCRNASRPGAWVYARPVKRRQNPQFAGLHSVNCRIGHIRNRRGCGQHLCVLSGEACEFGVEITQDVVAACVRKIEVHRDRRWLSLLPKPGDSCKPDSVCVKGLSLVKQGSFRLSKPLCLPRCFLRITFFFASRYSSNQSVTASCTPVTRQKCALPTARTGLGAAEEVPKRPRCRPG